MSEIDEMLRLHTETRRAVLQAMLIGVFGPLLSVVASPRVSGSEAKLQADNYKLIRKSAMLSLDEISDHLEIEDLITRYCYAVDDRDWAAYRNIFTADAVIDDTVTGGVRSGLEEHVVYMRRALAKIVMSQHAISTILIDAKGNDARVRAHCSCPMVLDRGNGKTDVLFQGLWYRDRLVRTPAGWRIKELVEEGYWRHNAPPGFQF